MTTPEQRLAGHGTRAKQLAVEIATLASEANDLVKESVLYRCNEAAIDLLVFSNRVERGTLTFRKKEGE